MNINSIVYPLIGIQMEMGDLNLIVVLFLLLLRLIKRLYLHYQKSTINIITITFTQQFIAKSVEE